MKNIAVPGVFPLFVAIMLALLAIRAHVTGKRYGDKRYALSKVMCIMGTCIFILIAIFQILEANGILFR